MATVEQLELDQYLAADELIQADHPEIVRTAEMITRGATDPRDKAVRIFYWVRDHIAYCIEADRPALEVLREGRGVCVTKALLHVALLRAAGVPARLGHADYRSQVLRPMFPAAYMDRQPQVYPLHTFAEVYLDGRWITCDATVDREFARDLGFTLNEFDGIHPTETMPGDSNVVRRYSSSSGPEMMQLYTAALGDIGISHEELRRQYQLLDVYVDLLRLRKRLEASERNIVMKLLT
jgi:transglutaminase-like putative cysteine protease